MTTETPESGAKEVATRSRRPKAPRQPKTSDQIMQQRFVSVWDIVDLLGFVSPNVVYKTINQMSDVPRSRIGRVLRYELKDVLTWYNECKYIDKYDWAKRQKPS